MGWFGRSDPDEKAAAGGPRLLVATFGRLLWYFPATDSHRVVHEGRGKYYGLASVDDGGRELLVVSRPDQESDDRLLRIDQWRGKRLEKIQLASRDTHQAVRHGDTLWVTDTFRGNVLAYDLPGLALCRTYGGFTHENHVNSVLVEGGDLLVLCHNKGRSWMARVSIGTGEITERYEDVGEHSHDILRHGDSYLLCDSRGGALIEVDRTSHACRTLHVDEGHFTKGLAIHEGVAYFGTSRAATRAERMAVSCDLVAYDLAAGRTLWRRPIPSGGLINAITTPETLQAQRRG